MVTAKTRLEWFTDFAIYKPKKKRREYSIKTKAIKEFAYAVGSQRQGDADQKIFLDTIEADYALAMPDTLPVLL